MNTLEIISRLKFCKSFKGVYPVDLIPKYFNSGTIIINTDPSTKPGSHWVAVYINNDTGEYFDSFGFPPINKEIISFLDNNSTNGWSYNSLHIQNLLSHTCGNYCVLYVMAKNKGYSITDFLNLFTMNTDLNEIILKILYKGVN